MISGSRLFGRLTVLVASTVALGLGGCGSTATTSETETPETQATTVATEAQLQVVTTFLPMTQFTKAVVGDRAAVVQLMPTNVGPHDFQARPGDIQAIVNADVLVKNGLEIESFLDSLIENARNDNLVIIDSSKGIPTIANQDHDHGHGHDHKHDHGHEHDHDHDHGHGHDHHHHGEFNPHIWLDPKRAIQQVQNIRDGLIAADPEGAEKYTANAAAFIEKLRELDAEITKKLEPFSGKTFVVFHDFAPYFAESYNLRYESFVGIPEQNPSPQDVQRVMNTVAESGLQTILTEPQVDQDMFSKIAQDMGIGVGVFYPMGTGNQESLEPEYYLRVMRENVQNLLEAFGGGQTQSWLPLSTPKSVAVIPQPVRLRF